jgi:hypothetical protein
VVTQTLSGRARRDLEPLAREILLDSNATGACARAVWLPDVPSGGAKPAPQEKGRSVSSRRSAYRLKGRGLIQPRE